MLSCFKYYIIKTQQAWKSIVLKLRGYAAAFRPAWCWGGGCPTSGGVGAVRGVEISLDGAIGPRNKFVDIFSHVDTVDQRDRRTDTGRQQRPRLRIASRGKNEWTWIRFVAWKYHRSIRFCQWCSPRDQGLDLEAPRRQKWKSWSWS